jgi:hypothetical protein
MDKYKSIIEKEARFYGISICESKDMRYWEKTNTIGIPKENFKTSLDLYNALVVMGHLIVKNQRPAYMKVYKVAMWVYQRYAYYNIPLTPDIDLDCKQEVLYALMKYNNCRGDRFKIPREIREYLKELEPDFNTWSGVRVCFDYNWEVRKVADAQIAEAEQKRKSAKRLRIAKMVKKI